MGPSDGSVQTTNARKRIEPRVESKNFADMMLLHYRYMNGISRGQSPVFQHNLLGAFHCIAGDRQDLVYNRKHGIKGGLDCLAAVDGDIAVQDFLQGFRIGYQALARTDEFFQPPLSIYFVLMRRADQIHGNIGIDQDHDGGPPV